MEDMCPYLGWGYCVWAVKGQILLLLFVTIGGGISTFMTVRRTKKRDKQPLNNWGVAAVLFLMLTFVLGVYFLVDDKRESLRMECVASNESAKVSSDLASIKNDNKIIQKELETARLADSTVRADIKKSGYQYSGGKVTPLQQNIQKVEKGANAIQNNAPNSGIQNVGDNNDNSHQNTGDITVDKRTIVNKQWELSDPDRQHILGIIDSLMVEFDLEELRLELCSNGNGQVFYDQLLKALQDGGYNPKYGIDLGATKLPSGILYVVDTVLNVNRTLKLRIGRFYPPSQP